MWNGPTVSAKSRETKPECGEKVSGLPFTHCTVPGKGKTPGRVRLRPMRVSFRRSGRGFGRPDLQLPLSGLPKPRPDLPLLLRVPHNCATGGAASAFSHTNPPGRHRPQFNPERLGGGSTRLGGGQEKGYPIRASGAASARRCLTSSVCDPSVPTGGLTARRSLGTRSRNSRVY